jgi:hypothetical protein
VIHLALTLMLGQNPPQLTEKQQERFAMLSRAYNEAWYAYILEESGQLPEILVRDFYLKNYDDSIASWDWYGKHGESSLDGFYHEYPENAYHWFAITIRSLALRNSFVPKPGFKPDLFANPEARNAFRASLLSELAPKGFAWQDSRWKKDGYLYFSRFSISLSANAEVNLDYQAPVETDLTNILSLDDAFAVIQDELPLAKGPDPKFMRVEFTPGLSGNNMKKDAPDYELTSAGKGVAVYHIIGNDHQWFVSATTGALLSSNWYSGTTGMAANPNHVLSKPLPYPVTLPNGWLVFLTLAKPQEEQTWQPTTLTLPDNTTQKALISENGFFIKTEDGKTFMVGRIPN